MKKDVFNVELNKFENDNVRKSAEIILNMLPDYFYEIAASSSGKYHPLFSLNEGGLVRHVKVAMRILEEMFKDEVFGTYDSYKKDYVFNVVSGKTYQYKAQAAPLSKIKMQGTTIPLFL